jgi:hypothetical protein
MERAGRMIEFLSIIGEIDKPSKQPRLGGLSSRTLGLTTAVAFL